VGSGKQGTDCRFQRLKHMASLIRSFLLNKHRLFISHCREYESSLELFA
jgi:hypothetical protein